MKVVYFGKKNPKIIRVVNQENYVFESSRAFRENAVPSLSPQKNISLLVCDVKETVDYAFVPFKEMEVPVEVGKKLIAKPPHGPGNIFFVIGDAQRKKKNEPDYVPDTEGYVGDVAADKLGRPVKEQRIIDAKAEEGKSVEEVIAEANRKKRSRKNVE